MAQNSAARSGLSKSSLLRGVDSYRGHRGMLMRMVLSFMTVTGAVLIIAVLGLFRQFQTAMLDDIERRTQDMLAQTFFTFESVHQWVVSAFVGFGMDPDISMVMRRPSLELNYDELSRVMARIQTVKSTYPLLHSVMLWNGPGEFAFSSIRGPESDGEFTDRDLPELVQRASIIGAYRYIPRRITVDLPPRMIPDYLGLEHESDVLTMVFGLFPSADLTNRAVVVNLREPDFRAILTKPRTSEDHDLFVIDRRGQIILSSDPIYFGSQAVDFPYLEAAVNAPDQPSGFLYGSGADRRYVSHLADSDQGWSFVSSVPYGVVFSGILTLRNLAIAVTVGLVIVAWFAVLLVSRSIYRPVSRLSSTVERLRIALGEGASGHGDGEIDAANETLTTLYSRFQGYRERLAQNERLQLGRRVLLGIETQDLPVPFRAEYIAAIRIDHFRAIEAGMGADDLSSVRAHLADTIRRLLPDEAEVFSVRPDELVAVWRGEQSLAKLQADIGSAMKSTVTIGWVPVPGDGEPIASAYRAVHALVRQRFVAGHGSCLGPREFESIEVADESYAFPEHTARICFEDAKLGKTGSAIARLDEIIEGVAAYTEDDFDLLAQLLAHSARHQLLGSEHDAALDEAIGDSISALRLAETGADVRGTLLRVFDELHDWQRESRGSRHSEIVRATRCYLESQFQEPSTCPDSAAAHIGLTTNYLRDVFREYAGISLTDYLNDLRIEHCKTLLRDTTVPAKDAFAASGFTSYTYSFTAFKKRTGLTPMQYRAAATPN